MSNIVEVIVDPILGDDATGQPVSNGSVIHFYRTIDGAIDSVGDYDLLIVKINKGEVSLDEDTYTNIIINKMEETSRLKINTKVGSSITMNNVILNINTDIILPEDEGTSEDVPAIIVNELLYVTHGNDLSLIDTFDEDSINRPRVVIRAIGACIFDNQGGIIFVPTRDVIFIEGGQAILLGSFEEITTTDSFNMVRIDENNIFCQIGDIDIRQMWNINRINRIVPANNSKMLQKKNNSKMPIRTMQRFSPFQIAVLVVASVVSLPATVVGVTISAFTGGIGTQVASQVKSKIANQLNGKVQMRIIEVDVLTSANKARKESIKAKRSKSIDVLLSKNHPKKVMGLYQKAKDKLINEEDQPEVQNGAFIIQDPETIEGFVTNSPDVNIEDPNLVNFELHEDIQEDDLDYSNTYKYNSYSNSGSIFRDVKVLDSDYTHTRFDGNVFVVDATNGNIVITVPTDVLENRLLTYKRIDNSRNRVTIVTPKGIDNKANYNLKNKCYNEETKKFKHLGKVQLVGHEGKLWII